MTDIQSTDHEAGDGQVKAQPSDARIILGPLVKYAAIGSVLVAIIITTAVMLDRQFNTIDQEVAALQAQLEKARENADTPETDATATPATDDTPETGPSAVPQLQPAAAVVNTATLNPAIQGMATPYTVTTEERQAEITAAQDEAGAEPRPADTPVAEATEPVAEIASTADVAASVQVPAVTVRTHAADDFFDSSMDAFIADRDAYLRERDRIYLEEYRASQRRQLQLMRERLARQEQRIREMEQRYRELYDIRAADLEEMQERREQFFSDRI